MAKKTDIGNVGYWAFLIGILIALIAGLASAAGALGTASGTVTAVLVILGIVVGFLNLMDKDSDSFLIAGIALVLVGVSSFNALDVVGRYLASILQNVAAFVAPAVALVALKMIWDLASK